MVSEQQKLCESGQPNGQSSANAAADGSKGRVATIEAIAINYEIPGAYID